MDSYSSVNMVITDAVESWCSGERAGLWWAFWGLSRLSSNWRDRLVQTKRTKPRSSGKS